MYINWNICAFDWIVLLAEDLSPLPEAENDGVTVTESLTPITETASSNTNNALQLGVSENQGDATTRDCSIQYETSISPLGGNNVHRITVWSFRQYAGYDLKTNPINKLFRPL